MKMTSFNLALALVATGAVVMNATSSVSAATTPLKIGLVEARPETEPWSLAWHNSVEAMVKKNPGTKVIETYDAYDATRAEPVIRQMLNSGVNVMAISSFVLKVSLRQ